MRAHDSDTYAIGPATALLYAEADPLGCLRYRVAQHRERVISFGPEQSDTFWGVLDQVLTTALFRPPSPRLCAVGALGPPGLKAKSR